MDYDDTVLFVDDEENILSSLRRGLIDEPYTCLFAGSGYRALEILAQRHVSVIVSDMKMPGMDGLKLLKEVKEKYPKTVRIVLSGFTQLQQIIVTINQADIFKFITKPWKLEDDFTDVIRQALEYHHLQLERDEFEHALKVQNAAYQNTLRRIEDLIFAAKRNSQMFAALATGSFDVAMKGMDETGNPALVRRNLQAANLFFNYFSDVDAEELVHVRPADLCRQIDEAVGAMENVVRKEFDYSTCTEGYIRTKPRLFGTLVRAAIGVLGSSSTSNYVKMMAKMVPVQDGTQLELSLLTSDMTIMASKKQKDDYKKNQDINIDALQPLAGEVARFIGGTFQSARVDNIVLAKICVKTLSDERGAGDGKK